MMADLLIWEKAEQEAAKYHSRFQHSDGLVDLPALCAAFGLKVFRSSALDDGVSGMIQKDSANSAVHILLNAQDSPLRQRFTLAHEIGHFVERHEASDDAYAFFDYRGKDYDLHEFFADHFAGALLIPTSILEKVVPDISSMSLSEALESAPSVASHFRVSVAAARMRIFRLFKQGTFGGSAA